MLPVVAVWFAAPPMRARFSDCHANHSHHDASVNHIPEAAGITISWPNATTSWPIATFWELPQLQQYPKRRPRRQLEQAAVEPEANEEDNGPGTASRGGV